MNFIAILAILTAPINPHTKVATAKSPDTVAIHRTMPKAGDVAKGKSLKNDPNNKEVVWIQDVYTQPYDSLVVALRTKNVRSTYDSFFKDFIDIESVEAPPSQIPDSVYEARLKKILSPIQMPYNDVVKRYILVYTTSRKGVMENVLGRSQYYFPMIEEELDRAGLPIELRMLPVIESALSPSAVSSAGAAGLWQFMYTTGKTYGLEINSFIDQRRDPVKSTKAACWFLKDLYNIYGDWTLALAAYNCGPGNVNKAIKRAGGEVKNFWDIYPYLPKETRGYVPSFIAATYAYAYHYQHNITANDARMPLSVDTVMISRPTHFDQISSTINTPTEVIRSLNPQYKSDFIPATGKEYSLILPTSDIGKFVEHEEQINAKDTLYLSQYLNPASASAVTPASPQKAKAATTPVTTYKVKSGDTLGKIASRYNVTVSQLMKWNNIKSANKLQIGQRLEIRR